MSTPSATVVAPDGKPVAHATGMNGGGLALSPLPLSGGRKRSRKMTKKMKKMLKTLKKIKGGDVGDVADTANLEESGLNEVSTEEGGRRRRRGSRRSRRGSKRHGRPGLFY
jgi:hypothetical protein